MSDFERLVELCHGEEVEHGVSIPRVHMHKWLVLGQTDYLCEYGTLSDGHEKFTDAQKYAQSLKQLHQISLSIQDQEALAMLAQADLLDAEEQEKTAEKPSEKLRVEAKIKQAKTRLLVSLTNVEDQTRMAKFYYRKIKELGPRVEQQYPKGIEQAEPDNWRAVFEYRMRKGGGRGAGERVDNVPLDPRTKAILGIEHGRPDAIAPLEIVEKSAICAFAGGDVTKYLTMSAPRAITKEAKDGGPEQGREKADSQGSHPRVA